jgi:glycosyltransferase involved in cell wall biosynthesis
MKLEVTDMLEERAISSASYGDHEIEVSIVMPCLNEAETLAACITKALRWLYDHEIIGEVIVSDNGSSDGSQKIAISMGARLVEVDSKGYGNALMGGILAARGRYIIMGDADDSYDFSDLSPFIERLREGYDLVMGNRFKGGIKPGAMPPLHRYLGNPVLTTVGRILFRSPVGDFHCGLRAFRKDSVEKMRLQTTGMEFASEMVVKATLHGMKIAEVPTTLSLDGRSRPPHLRSWRDGWRHLRFLLLFSPRWLFLYPGSLLMIIGLGAGIWLWSGPKMIGRVTLDVHTLFYAAVAIIIGFQAVIFALFTKIFAISKRLLPEDRRLTKMFRYVTLEVGLITGSIVFLLGLIGSIYSFYLWEGNSFGPLIPSSMLRIVIPSGAALALGCQIILSSFFLSVLGLKRR